MSQKPKAGAQARPASATKVAPKEVVMKPAPAKVVPVARMEPVKSAPAKVAAPAKMQVPGKVDAPVDVAPVVKAEPPVIAAPASAPPAGAPLPIVTPAAVPEPVAGMAAAIEAGTPEPVKETIAAASDLAAASAKVVSTSLTTTADTVAAVTAEVVETAASISPTKPNLTPRNLTQGMKTMMKSTEDFVAFGQANLEAFVKSGQIWSAGVQELTKQFASSAKASFDESVSTFKAISTAKSVKEAMELQSTFAKAALEKAMAESNKLTDASIKLTEQTLAPITARVTVAVETFGKAA